MKEYSSLNQRQLTLLISTLIITKMLFYFPRFLFKTSGNAAWIEAIYVSLIAYVVLILSFAFFKYSGNRSVLELSECIGGIPLKIAVSLVCAVIIIANIATEMRMFAESVKIILLPKTKMQLIMLVFALTVIIGAGKGIFSLATINSLFFPVCLAVLGLLVLLLIPSYDFNNLFPVLGTGTKNILLNGLRDISAFSDILAINLLLPHTSDIGTVRKSGKNAVIISGITLTVICISFGLTYPHPYSSEFLLIPYQLSRMVRLGEYFQRFEAFFEFVWSIAQLLYSAIYIYILCHVFSSAFRLPYIKPIVPLVAILVALISFGQSSVVSFLDTAYSWKLWLMPVAFLIPIVIPLIYRIKRRGRGEK